MSSLNCTKDMRSLVWIFFFLVKFHLYLLYKSQFNDILSIVKMINIEMMSVKKKTSESSPISANDYPAVCLNYIITLFKVHFLCILMDCVFCSWHKSNSKPNEIVFHCHGCYSCGINSTINFKCDYIFLLLSLYSCVQNNSSVFKKVSKA